MQIHLLMKKWQHALNHFPIHTSVAGDYVPIPGFQSIVASQHVESIGCADYTDWDYQQWIEQTYVKSAEKRECQHALTVIATVARSQSSFNNKMRWASPRPRWRRRLMAEDYSWLKRCHLLQHKLRRYEFFEDPLLIAIIPAIGIYAKRRWVLGQGKGERQA